LGLFHFTANFSGMIDLKEITLSGVWSVLSEQLSEQATNPAPLRKSPIAFDVAMLSSLKTCV